MPETPAWYMEFVGAVVARLPREIDEAAARRWVGSPDLLEEALAGALIVSAVGGIDPGAPFLNDKTSEGFELLEDVSEPTEFAAENLGEVQIFGDDESFAVGDDVVDRVRSMSPKLGQRHAEYLHAHPEMIPEAYNRITLVFGGRCGATGRATTWCRASTAARASGRSSSASWRWAWTTRTAWPLRWEKRRPGRP